MPRIPELEQYRSRSEETGQPFWTCPAEEGIECPGGQRFESLGGFKSHMSKFHGGYTASDVSVSSASEREAGADTGRGSAPARPRRMSARNRELNDKVNEALNLCVKHFVDGLDEPERQRLGVLRGEVLVAVAGVEFDFEERLISLRSKWVIVAVLAALYVLPQLPSLKEVIARSKAKPKPDEEEKANVNE
jgi:hypothetical protein